MKQVVICRPGHFTVVRPIAQLRDIVSDLCGSGQAPAQTVQAMIHANELEQTGRTNIIRGKIKVTLTIEEK